KDGTKQAFHIEKLTAHIRRLCFELDERKVCPHHIVDRVIPVLYDGITTQNLSQVVAETAASLETHHWHYGILGGRISISDLHAHTNKKFSSVISKLCTTVKSARDPVERSIESSVYNAALQHGDALDSALIHSRDFAFSFKDFITLQRNNLLWLDGTIVERPQQMIMRVALEIHEGELAASIDTYNYLSSK
ncbi:ribonucleotide reductase R1 subunit, partial [Zopfia rhizophila CBS 207.26]